MSLRNISCYVLLELTFSLFSLEAGSRFLLASGYQPLAFRAFSAMNTHPIEPSFARFTSKQQTAVINRPM
jgi:hypothetical protein